MADSPVGQMRERYNLFCNLDDAVSAMGPDDVSPQLAEELVKVLRESARQQPISPGSATLSGGDLAWLEQAADPPTFEVTWERFKADIRGERLRLGRKLGIEQDPN